MRGKTVRLGYLTQEPAAVDPRLRTLEAAQQVRSFIRVGDREISASQLLDSLGLTGERQWTLVGELSGGERRRLQLLMLLMAEPNVLLLDEPTNDLDIETLTELEDLLDGWPGSLVVVSHDRYFIERVTDHVLALLDGQLAYLPGGVAEYMDRRELQARPGRAGPGSAGPGSAGSGLAAGRGLGVVAGLAQAPGPGTASGPGTVASVAARRRDGQKELRRVERQLAKLADQEVRLSTDMAEHASEYARLIELGGQLRAVQTEKTGLEDRWLTLAEELGE